MKRTLKKRIEVNVGTFAVYILRAFFLCLPSFALEAMGKGLGILIYHLSKRYRTDGFRTLKTALPNLTPKEASQLCKKNFQHFGIVGVDLITASRLTKEKLEQSIQVEGIHHIDNAIKKGKGIICLTAHFGNWERISSLMVSKGYAINVVARSADDPKLNRLLERLRGRFGVNIIYKGNAIRAILKKLSQNEIVWILADQNSAEGFITFFNQPCGTELGPGIIQARTQCAVITAWCKRIGPSKYIFTIEPEIENLPPQEEQKGLALMQVYNERLENQVRQAPEQWLWFHDRWKYTRMKGLVK